MGEQARKFAAYLKVQAWYASEVADMIERGDMEGAESLYWALDLDTGFWLDKMAQEGQELLNHEHTEAVERRTA